MKSTNLQQLQRLQHNPACIRNICILAHVDHGKTTLSDMLVASNGIISHRLAGKLRYMDSLPDEQQRGITMKSSAIALKYTNAEGEFLINLIDSPGHIDFSSEVSTAVRICDGAVVLVDVVEGVCPQTHAVLRQAWHEKIRPVLILNKIDRLILELKMSPSEAYLHLKQILEQVNAITGELFTATHMEMKSNERQVDVPADMVYDWSSGLDDIDDTHLYFSPDQGNVLFSSAIDGWAFGIKHFVNIYASKLNMSIPVLKKTLWGDFYIESKTKKIKVGAQAKGKKPLFVQLILDNLWAVYDAVMIKRDTEKIDKVLTSLQLKIPQRDRNHADRRVQLRTITSQWLPLSDAVLDMAVNCLPTPLDISQERVEKLICSNTQSFEALPEQSKSLRKDFMACSTDPQAPVIVYISKMVCVDTDVLPQNRRRPLTADEIAARREVARQRHLQLESHNSSLSTTASAASDNIVGDKIREESDRPSQDRHAFIAFARIFSGTLRRGLKVYILGPKHNPQQALSQLETADGDSSCIEEDDHLQSFVVSDLYLFMGKELEMMDEVPAGNILGIGGLENIVIKSATLSTTVACPAFTDMFFDAAPIVRVALEPKHPGDMSKLKEGLRLLNQADPCVSVYMQGTGEHVIVTAGEVHLQKCIDDLKNQYARIEVNVSPPIVPFRETIIQPTVTDSIGVNNPALKYESSEELSKEVLAPGIVQVQTANRLCTVRVRCVPLPEPATRLLEENADLILALDRLSLSDTTTPDLGQLSLSDTTTPVPRISKATCTALKEFKEKLMRTFSECEGFRQELVEKIWSFGPKKNGPNILINNIAQYMRPSIWGCVGTSEAAGCPRGAAGRLRDLDDSIISGFQMATLAGPLCEEPMRGVCYFLDQWDIHPDVPPEKEMDHAYNLADSPPGDMGALIVPSDMADTADLVRQVVPSDMADTADLVRQSGASSGQLISCVKDACRRAFCTQPQRLMIAMYGGVVQATAEVLGKLYGVLGKHHGRILQEEMREGSSFFNISIVLPVIESFGFSDKIRRKTSGLASPQLKFSHWEVLDTDPFWVPRTEEEYTHYGEKADSENLAYHYMNLVRRRKGLKTQDKLVEFAEKQRTRSRNK